MKSFVFLALLFLFGASCATNSGAMKEPDIRGDWKYEYKDMNFNVYDSGSISFSGSPVKGEYLVKNYYGYEYQGYYELKDGTYFITGSMNMELAQESKDKAQGTWKNGEDSGKVKLFK